MQEITAEQLKNPCGKKGYRAGDVIGKAGLEQVYEDELHGENGARLYIIDENNKEKEELAKKRKQLMGKPSLLRLTAACSKASTHS
ncbi:hypothetical protein GCM10020331_070760 [Ectobacillus funiculus]